MADEKSILDIEGGGIWSDMDGNVIWDGEAAARGTPPLKRVPGRAKRMTIMRDGKPYGYVDYDPDHPENNRKIIPFK